MTKEKTANGTPTKSPAKATPTRVQPVRGDKDLSYSDKWKNTFNVAIDIKKEKVTPKKPTAKRALSFKDKTDATLLMDSIKPSEKAVQSPAKTVPMNDSEAPLISAGTVRFG